MKYQALYRAYRPQLFSDMVGQEHITKTIQNAIIQNKVSHAYLFSGPRGTGKTTTAKIIAKAINCLNGPSVEPCNQCSVCLGIDSGEITDVIEIDAASNNGVDEIREIRDKVKYAPTSTKFKVYIIDEVHMLSTGAFNALLKTLEEPPAHVIFILATTEPHKIPLTIISRCQRFDFKKIGNKEIVHRLSQVIEQENISVNKKALYLVAKLADGGMRDALSLLDQAISYADEVVTEADIYAISGTVAIEKLEELFIAITSKNPTLALSLVEEFNEIGKDIVRLTEDLIFYFRDILLYKNVPNLNEVRNNIYITDNIKEICNTIDDEFIYSAIETLNSTLNEMKFTNHPKVFLELGLVKLSKKVSLNTEVTEKIVYVEVPKVTVEPKPIIEEKPIVQESVIIKETPVEKVEPVIEDLIIEEPINEEQIIEENQELLIDDSPVYIEEDQALDLLPPDGQVSMFDDLIEETEIKKYDKVVTKETTSTINETTNSTEDDIEYEYELDLDAYLNRVKDIRINNALALANKDTLEFYNEKWKNIILFASDAILGPIAGLLLDSRVRVASDHSMILSFVHESFADRCNQQLNLIEDFVAEVIGRKIKIIAISDVDWLKIKDEYITRKRRGETYVPSLEPDESMFMIKVKKKINKVQKQELEIDPIVKDAMDLFGKDILDIK